MQFRKSDRSKFSDIIQPKVETVDAQAAAQLYENEQLRKAMAMSRYEASRRKHSNPEAMDSDSESFKNFLAKTAQGNEHGE